MKSLGESACLILGYQSFNIAKNSCGIVFFNVINEREAFMLRSNFIFGLHVAFCKLIHI